MAESFPAWAVSEAAVFTATLNWTVQFREISAAAVLGAFDGGLPAVDLGVRDAIPRIAAVQTNIRTVLAPGYVVKKEDTSRFNASSVGVHVLFSGNVYKVRCFPATGNHQLPGIKRNDLEDGRCVLRAWLQTLEQLGVGRFDAGAPRDPQTGTRCFVLHKENVSLMNAKFSLGVSPDGGAYSLDLCALRKIIDGAVGEVGAFGAAGGAGGAAGAAGGAGGAGAAGAARSAGAAGAGGGPCAPEPFQIRMVIQDVKAQKLTVSFFRLIESEAGGGGTGKKRTDVTPQVNINTSGKFTLLGEKSFPHIVKIRDFFAEVLAGNPGLVRLRAGPKCPDDGAETDDEAVDVGLRSEYAMTRCQQAAAEVCLQIYEGR